MEDKNTKKTLSTEPYKGVRDFYPEDMFILNYIFWVMRKSVERFGFVEYNASILEPSELYKAKSGEEIVNEQTYSFKDRGDRDVTLRPEMTPTVTRMVAARKRELSFPLRWFSIPNLFRYEKPQRGRLREHYQLNVDIFGIETNDAEVEIISVAAEIMKNFGAKDGDYKIKVNNRKILNYLLEEIFSLKDSDVYSMTKLIDKKDKISAEEFKTKAEAIVSAKHIDLFISLLSSKTIDEFKDRAIEQSSSTILGVEETKTILEKVSSYGIKNVVFDPTLARGFDYYTGIVFEVVDTNPENPRAMFGGGRFDDLLSIFGSDKVPAVGFGMGDVTVRDFLETHGLLPKYTSKTKLAICPMSEKEMVFAGTLAQNLRNEGLNIILDVTGKKIGQQIQWASKNNIPYIMVIGEDEIKNKKFAVKELESGKETEFKHEKELIEFLKK